MESKNTEVILPDVAQNPLDRCAPGVICLPRGVFHPLHNVSTQLEYKTDNGDCALNFLWLEVTPRCNLKCIHCYSDSGPRLPLTHGVCYENWLSILKEAFVLGCRKIQFTGGEPTLYPYLSQLIEDAQAIGYEFLEVFTNGTLLNDILLKTFQQFHVNLAFTVFASDPSIHDAITQREGSFLKTTANIRRAIEYGVPVRVGIISMELNSSHLERTVAFLQEVGVQSISVDQVRSMGRGNALSPNGFVFTEFCKTCWCGTLCIDSNGQAFPCIFARFFHVGNIDDGLKTILQSKELRKFRDREREKTMGQSARETGAGKYMCSPGVAPADPHCVPSQLHQKTF